MSFKPVEAITAVRYDRLDRPRELQRPGDFTSLVGRLQAALGFDPATEGNDDVEGWAANRVRLTDEATFGAWMALERTFARLPRVVVYPRVDGRSPEKAPVGPSPAQPTSPPPSCATPSSTRRARQEEFCADIRELDAPLGRCLVPGCYVTCSEGDFVGVEAAHIIPHAVLNMSRRQPLYTSLLGDAGLQRGDIDRPCNGMLLCLAHHKTFDRCLWTVDPNSMAIDVRPGVAGDLLAMVGRRLDFSHRPEPHWRPSRKLWAAYNEFVYRDEGARLAGGAEGRGARGGAAVARPGAGRGRGRHRRRGVSYIPAHAPSEKRTRGVDSL